MTMTLRQFVPSLSSLLFSSPKKETSGEVISVGYFYPDGIINDSDGSSTPQIDGTINKETL
jgi:hypothetical protein